jgi:ketosteroid isomerase-like protein
MKLQNVIMALLITASTAWCQKATVDSIETWKKDVLQTERDFQKKAGDEGIGPAFTAFADENAVILRGGGAVKGKKAIGDFYARLPANEKVVLTWEPDFVDVSSCGDMAYTYGNYRRIVYDSRGKSTSSSGVFHTVWKRQPGGSWKFVWD